jgi:Ca-activated chloride channel family protein
VKNQLALTALTTVISFASTATTWPQEASGHARPSFGVDLEVVNLSVSVADRARNYVTGLERQDFAILEDGVPQEVSVFDRHDVPVSVAILIDSSLSMQPRMAIVQAAALRLVRALRAQDTARVVQFNHRQTVVQDFTSDKALLEAAVRSIHPQGATGLYNAVYLTLRELGRRPSSDELRKRAMVILSDGADTTSLLNDDQVLEAARRAEVTIFSVGLGIAASKDTLGPEASRARYFLTTLAEETGGQPFFPRALGELDEVYDRIGQELSTQYSLGYVSSNAARDGKWRRVVVNCARGGLVMRHRAGYYAGSPARTRATVPRPSPQVTRTAIAGSPK